MNRTKEEEDKDVKLYRKKGRNQDKKQRILTSYYEWVDSSVCVCVMVCVLCFYQTTKGRRGTDPNKETEEN